MKPKKDSLREAGETERRRVCEWVCGYVCVNVGRGNSESIASERGKHLVIENPHLQTPYSISCKLREGFPLV